jgi:hypothetical protein
MNKNIDKKQNQILDEIMQGGKKMIIKINEREQYTLELPDTITIQELSVVIERLKKIISINKFDDALVTGVRVHKKRNKNFLTDKDATLELIKIFEKQGIEEAYAYARTKGFNGEQQSVYNIISKGRRTYGKK